MGSIATRTASVLCPASAEQSTPARQMASEPPGTVSRKFRVALRHSMKTFDSWNQIRCLRGDVAPKCAPPRNRNLKTAKPCSPGAAPAAKTAGGSPPSCVKRSSATPSAISHHSNTRIVRGNSNEELEFVHLGRKIPKGLFRQIEQSIGVTVGSPPNSPGGLSFLKMN